MKTRAILLLAGLSIAAVAFAFDGVTLKRIPKEGQARKYKMVATIDFGDGEIPFNKEINEKVVKVTDKGDFSVERTEAVRFEGMPTSEGTTRLYVYHADGSLAKIDSESATPTFWRAEILTHVKFPEKPVAIDESWTEQIAADSKTGVVAATAKYTLLGEEKVGDTEVYKVKVATKETAGSDPGYMDGTVWLSKEDGSMVKYEGRWYRAPVAPAPGAVDGKFTITLVPKG